LGAAHLENLIVATGHYRNGVLLAPTTADAIATVLRGGELPAVARPFAADRFNRAVDGAA
jgi:glycine oxidase